MNNNSSSCSSSSSNNSSNATSSNRAGGGIVLAARVLPQGPKGLRLSTGEAAGGVGGGTPGMPTKLHVVDDHVVCAAAGVVPDAIALVAAAREAAAEHRRASRLTRLPLGDNTAGAVTSHPYFDHPGRVHSGRLQQEIS